MAIGADHDPVEPVGDRDTVGLGEDRADRGGDHLGVGPRDSSQDVLRLPAVIAGPCLGGVGVHPRR
jgi:hypothetical protein